MIQSEISIKNRTTAKQLLAQMQILYGKRFEDLWKNVDEDVLIEMTTKIINDLSDKQIQNGVKTMLVTAWPPSLPEFRKWCLTSEINIPQNEAWLKALIYDSSNETTEISTFIKEALLYVKKGFNSINSANSNHENTFKEYYAKIVNNALINNRQDQIIAPKKAKNEYKDIKNKPIKLPEHLREQLKNSFKK